MARLQERQPLQPLTANPKIKPTSSVAKPSNSSHRSASSTNLDLVKQNAKLLAQIASLEREKYDLQTDLQSYRDSLSACRNNFERQKIQINELMEQILAVECPANTSEAWSRLKQDAWAFLRTLKPKKRESTNMKKTSPLRKPHKVSSPPLTPITEVQTPPSENSLHRGRLNGWDYREPSDSPESDPNFYSLPPPPPPKVHKQPPRLSTPELEALMKSRKSRKSAQNPPPRKPSPPPASWSPLPEDSRTSSEAHADATALQNTYSKPSDWTPDTPTPPQYLRKTKLTAPRASEPASTTSPRASAPSSTTSPHTSAPVSTTSPRASAPASTTISDSANKCSPRSAVESPKSATPPSPPKPQVWVKVGDPSSSVRSTPLVTILGSLGNSEDNEPEPEPELPQPKRLRARKSIPSYAEPGLKHKMRRDK